MTTTPDPVEAFESCWADGPPPDLAAFVAQRPGPGAAVGVLRSSTSWRRWHAHPAPGGSTERQTPDPQPRRRLFRRSLPARLPPLAPTPSWPSMSSSTSSISAINWARGRRCKIPRPLSQPRRRPQGADRPLRALASPLATSPVSTSTLPPTAIGGSRPAADAAAWNSVRVWSLSHPQTAGTGRHGHGLSGRGHQAPAGSRSGPALHGGDPQMLDCFPAARPASPPPFITPTFCPVYDVGEVNGPLPHDAAHPRRAALDLACRAGPLSQPDACALDGFDARAVHVAHQAGVIHRDLKPSNVMIRDGTEPVVMDWPLARRESAAEDPRLTATGVVPAPAHMPPEQIVPTRRASARPPTSQRRCHPLTRCSPAHAVPWPCATCPRRLDRAATQAPAISGPTSTLPSRPSA